MPDPDMLSPLRAMHSLREPHVALLTQTMAGFAGRWTLERHESYDGDLTVLLVPTDPAERAFVISRSAEGFHLSRDHGDEMNSLGVFASFPDLLATLPARAPLTTTTNRSA